MELCTLIEFDKCDAYARDVNSSSGSKGSMIGWMALIHRNFYDSKLQAPEAFATGTKGFAPKKISINIVRVNNEDLALVNVVVEIGCGQKFVAVLPCYFRVVLASD